MIVTDFKGEIFRSTAGYRKYRGSQVFLFAPGSERSHRYNPLDFIRADRGDRTTDIQNMAAILVPEVTESENSIWQATAQQVIAGAISYINESVYYKGHRTRRGHVLLQQRRKSRDDDAHQETGTVSVSLHDGEF